MNINWTDVIIVVFVLLFVRAGWKYGLISNVFSGIGLIGGFAVGVYLVELFYQPGSTDPIVATSAIGLMIGCGLIGNIIMSFIGRLFKIPEGWPQRVNGAFGAVFGGALALAVAWAIGFAVVAAPTLSFSQSVRDSRVLDRIDTHMPTSAASQLSGLTRTITTDVFPRYLSPFEREIVVEVDAPDPGILEDRRLRKAAQSVVSVTGRSKCKEMISGSGFVYAPELVMTNAHVVAGVASPKVTINKTEVDATTVVFDPQLDVAVLRVKGLKSKQIDFTKAPSKGDRAALVGYPKGGPLTASAARVRGVMVFDSPDIYQKGKHPREVVSIRGEVLPGNSGGPLLTASGDVLGVIFAASSSAPNTGYALTAAQVSAAADKGRSSTKAVPTGECA